MPKKGESRNEIGAFGNVFASLVAPALFGQSLVGMWQGTMPQSGGAPDQGVQKGIARLLAFQVGGFTKAPLPNWRWLDMNGIADTEILERTFAGGRHAPTGAHHRWDELYMRVEPAA